MKVGGLDRDEVQNVNQESRRQKRGLTISDSEQEEGERENETEEDDEQEKESEYEIPRVSQRHNVARVEKFAGSGGRLDQSGASYNRRECQDGSTDDPNHRERQNGSSGDQNYRERQNGSSDDRNRRRCQSRYTDDRDRREHQGVHIEIGDRDTDKYKKWDTGDMDQLDTKDVDSSGNAGEITSADYEGFKSSYFKMDQAKKWVLSTGTIVEDRLYEFGLQCTQEQ